MSWPNEYSQPRDASGESWEWRELVYSEQFSDPIVPEQPAPEWSWRYVSMVFRISILPLFLTAVAMAATVLTLVGLFVKPLPWYADPPLNAPAHAAPVPGPPSAAPGAGRPGSGNPGPGQSSPATPGAGDGHSAPSTARPTATPSPSPTPTGPPSGTRTFAGTGSATTPPSSGGLLPLPSLGISLSASVPLPAAPGQLPLPGLSLSVSAGLPSLPLLPPIDLPGISIGLP